MRAKRVLAAVLCAAMIFSSEAFSMGVLANELSEPSITQTVTGETQTPDAPQAPAGEEGSTPESPENPKENAGISNVPETDADSTEDPSSVPEETEPAAPQETPDEPLEDVESVQPSDTPGDETPTIPDVTETPSTAPQDGESQDANEIPADGTVEAFASVDFLEVDEEGTLKLKEGQSVYGRTVVIPKEAKRIPTGIFDGKTGVQYIEFDPESQLEEIDAYAFKNSGILEIELPERVTDIKKGTFQYAENLTSITFKGNVTAVGEEAFANSGIQSINMPDVISVGIRAFSDCSNLTTVQMESLQTIGDYAFQNCDSLGSGMIWSSTLTSIGNSAFSNCGFSILNMTEIESDEIAISPRAFEKCRKLTSVTLPKGMKAVSNSMFENCNKLNKVTLPTSGSITEIGSKAFKDCNALGRIIIPESITVIQAEAFGGCDILKEILIHCKDEGIVIAQSAFPDKSKPTEVVMKGYSIKVEEYADKKGYTFQTLYEAKAIKCDPDEHAKIVCNKDSAVQGDEITISVTPASGWCLSSEGLRAVCNSQMIDVELVNCTGNTQVFRFIMPEDAVTVHADFAEVKTVVSGSLSFEFQPVNSYMGNYNKSTTTLSMAKTGQETKLVVMAKGSEMGPWLLNYTSDNASVATISDKGVICAKGKGDATITAALRSDSKQKVSFKVHVGGDAVITDLTLEIMKPSRAVLSIDSIDGEEYQVLEFNKATLAKGAQSFNVSVKATEAGRSGANLTVASDWSVIDKEIATISQAKSTTNSNTVTVKKGVEGETVVTVSVTNKDDDKSVCEKSFIIRVIDATPRLADSTISVNKQSTEGRAVDIITVYDYEINADGASGGLQLCKKKVTDGIVSYEPERGLRISETKEEYRIIATDMELGVGKSVTYKGNTQLYIKGQFDITGEEFIIPVPQLTVTNKALSPTVKTSGKINLFYNSKAEVAEQGSIAVTQSLTDEKVKGYKLVSEANHKKAGSEAEDTFAANFDIALQDNGSAVITRSDRETMAQVNGKDVVSGYLYIYYDGYEDPVVKSLKISTENKAPAYVLSATSATASTYRENQEYLLQLQDKKSKKAIALGEGTELGFDYSATTDGLFDANILDDNIVNDQITIKVKGTPKKGKAVINVRRDSWSKVIKYTFTLKTTSSHPAAKFSNATATLNALCKTQTATLALSMNSQDAELKGFVDDSLTYTGSSKYKEDAAKLKIVLKEDGRITVGYPEGGSIKATTYTFKIRPQIQYIDAKNKENLGWVTFKVAVKEDKPAIKLKNATFTLNTSYVSTDAMKTTYTINNLPAGNSYSLNDDSVKITSTSTKLDAIDSAKWIKLNLVKDADADTGSLTVSLDSAAGKKKFNYSYNVEGLKVIIDKEPIEVSKFTIKVKAGEQKPSIKISSKGTLNPVAPDSSIVYTAKVSNINSAISDVRIWELDENGNYYFEGDGREQVNRISEHFDVIFDRETNEARVKAKEGVILKSGTSYKFNLAYVLEAAPGEYQVTAKPYTVKPKQTLPKIKTDKSTAFLYAGQNRDKKVKVAISKTSMTDAAIEDVVFAKNTSAAIKKAYKIEYDKENDIMTLTLVNPAIIVLNKKQTLNFETRCINQLDGSTGTTFKLDMTVRK